MTSPGPHGWAPGGPPPLREVALPAPTGPLPARLRRAFVLVGLGVALGAAASGVRAALPTPALPLFGAGPGVGWTVGWGLVVLGVWGALGRALAHGSRAALQIAQAWTWLGILSGLSRAMSYVPALVDGEALAFVGAPAAVASSVLLALGGLALGHDELAIHFRRLCPSCAQRGTGTGWFGAKSECRRCWLTW